MISIIVPVYNTEGYLDDCVRSLAGQSFGDLEIILIDDASGDSSPEIIRRWAAKDGRIRAVLKEVNSGVSDSRNIGLQMARGEYIGFVDSDDWVEPEMFGELAGQLDLTGADIAFGGVRHILEGETIRHDVPEPTGTVLGPDDALLRILPQYGAGYQNLFVWDKLFRRDALIHDGEMILFNPAYSFCEDVLWLTQVLQNSRTVAFWQGCGYNYRIGRDGNTGTSLLGFKTMKYCVSGLETNLQIYEVLKAAGSRAANNQLQRVLSYRRYAFRTAAKLKDSESYRRYRRGFYPLVFKWYAGNRTLCGLKWLIMLMGGDMLFQLKRLTGRL